MSLRQRLGRRQLIVVTGKGGVGKTVLSAVVGRSLARAGRRVLVLEVDPRESLHHLLDVPPSGGAVVETPYSRLFLQNLKPRTVVDWIVERKLPVAMLARRVIASPIYQRFSEGAPGLEEMAVLGHALRLVRGDDPDLGPALDTVVLDAPATGHGVSLLTAPRLLAEAIGEGPFAELAGEVADFVAAPERCGVVVVTHAEEMPVQEAIELRAELAARFERVPELLVVNGVYPPLPPAPAAAAEDGDDGLIELWRRRRRLNERELERLARRWRGPRIELPLMPIPDGPPLVSALQERFDAVIEDLGAET